MGFPKLTMTCYGGSSNSNNRNELADKLKSVLDELRQPSNIDFDKVFHLLDTVLKARMSQKEEDEEEALRLCSELCGQGASLSDIIQKSAPNDEKKKKMILELVSKVLEAGGYGHIATTCLSLIAFGLKQYVTSRRNSAQCNESLSHIAATLQHIRNAYVLTLMPPKLLSPEKHRLFKEAALLILQSIFTIFRSLNRSPISRYFHAFIDKEDISDLQFKTGHFQMRLVLNHGEDIREHQQKNTSIVSSCGPTSPEIVGVEDKVTEVMDLLAFGESINTNEGTRCVCLKGMGGVGKSTLAQCVYDKLVNSSTTMKMRHHKIYLPMTSDVVLQEQKRMLKALTQKPIIENEFYSCDIGASEIAETVRSILEPIFILLDNLNLSDPSGSSLITIEWVLQMLLPKAHFFPTGSAVLVTTREHDSVEFFLHASMGFEIRQKQVECLDYMASKSVLYKSMSVADENDVPKYIRDKWKRPLLKECGGLPLMLKHVGGRIASEGLNNEDVWKRVVISLKQGKLVDGQLHSSLKSSICGLDEDYLNAFLDIVQCYEGVEWEEVEYKVGQNEMYTLWKCFLLRRLEILCEERGYIDIVSIHDVYRGIGRDIIAHRACKGQDRGQDDLESSICTRMDEFIQGINNNNEDCSIICLKLEAKYKSSKNLKLVMPQAYQHKMPWTWLKRCSNVIDIEIHIERDSNDDHRSPLMVDPCFDNQFCDNLPEDLLRLRIVGWEGLRDLRIMQCHKLERLSLEDCPNLHTLQLSPQALCSIRHLKLQCCCSVFVSTTRTSVDIRNPRLPITLFSSTFAPSLRYLFLQDYNNIVVSDEIIPHLSSSLQQLHLSKLKRLQSLHITANSSFSTITSLKHVFLHDCNKLTSIHLENITSMQSLHIYGCANLEKLELHNLSSLQNLSLTRETFGLPMERDSRKSLKYMKLSGLPCVRNRIYIITYENLNFLVLDNMTSLQSVYVADCNNLRIMGVSNLPCLTSLIIRRNPNLEALDWSSMTSLQELKVNDCHRFKRLALGSITSLMTLHLDDWINLKTVELSNVALLSSLSLKRCKNLVLPDISSMTSLGYLTLFGDSKLQILDLRNMNKLGSLDLKYCINLKTVELSNLASLSSLSLKRCKNLVLPDISSMTSLEYLALSGDSKLQILDLRNMNKLGSLHLNDCINLKTVELSNLASLSSLSLKRYKNLVLPDISSMTSLGYLTLFGDSKLQILDLRNMNKLGSLHLHDCINLKTVQLSNLASLSSLSLERCKNLVLPDISSLTSLESLTLSGDSKLQILDLRNMIKLGSLHLVDCINLKTVQLSNLTSLSSLHLIWCKNLVLPDISSLTSLKYLTLFCDSKLKILDLRNMNKLGSLHLHDCINLKTVQLSNLTSLSSLSLERCKNLVLPDISSLTSLEDLDLFGDSKLQILDLRNMNKLGSLHLHDCINLKTVQLSNLASLSSLSLERCKNLVLPDISSLTSLKYLDLFGDSKLQILDLRNMNKLGSLHLHDCINLKTVQLSNLAWLSSLHLERCKNLVLADISSLTSLKYLTLSGDSKLQILDLRNMNKLLHLFLQDCINLKTVQLSNLAWLSMLSLERCKNLVLPDISSLTYLKYLNLSGDSKLQILDLRNMIKLKYLILDDCISLKTVEHSSLTSLHTLSLSGCNNLELPDISSMILLRGLTLSGCTSLQMLDLGSLHFLVRLALDDCTNVKELKSHNCSSLKSLSLCRCNNLEETEIMQFLELEELNMGGCTRLERLDVSSMTSLKRLFLNGCSRLQTVEDGNGGRTWEKVEVDGCVNLKWQPCFGGGSQ